VCWFWLQHDRWVEAWDWLKSLLSATPARVTLERFFGVWYAGIFGTVLAKFQEAGSLLAEARAIAEALQDEQARAMAASATALALLNQGRLAEAEKSHKGVLPLARRVGPAYYLPTFLYIEGWIALRQLRLDRAARFLDESITTAKRLGDELAVVIALPLRGTVSLLQNDLSQAWTYLREAERISEGLPGRGLIITRTALGQLALLQGDIAAASRHFRTALEDGVQSGGRFLICDSLEGLALVAAAREDPRSAARLVAAVDVARASIGQRRPADSEHRVEAILSQLRSELGHAEFDLVWRTGKKMSLDEAIAFGRGVAPLPDGDSDRR
jgi:tetratricopeptide (TPR) repeat protein